MRRYQKIIYLQASLLSLPLSLSLRARRAWQSRSLMGLLRCSAPRNDNPFIPSLSVMTCIVTLVLIGIILMIPIGANGQTKERIILSEQSGRDPFLLPTGVHLLSKSDTALGVEGVSPKTETDRGVKAILIADHIRLALIDRHIVTVGDSIRDEKVLEIKTDRVILGKGDQKRTLLLPQSPVTLTVEEIKGEKK